MVTENVEQTPVAQDASVEAAPTESAFDEFTPEPAGPESVESDAPIEGGEAAPAASAPPPAPTVSPGAAPSAPAPQPAPATPQLTPEQIQKMMQESARYEQIQAQAEVQRQSDTYRQQLEAQGFLPEHAEQAANAYAQSQQQQTQLIQRADEYGKFLQGQQRAAEHFADKYKLAISDLNELRQYNDEVQMEKAAAKLAHDRARDDELAKFKQSRVPAQSLDNSQGSPEVAANEGSWLDKYNGGDRSPNAVSAAKRAAGLS